MQQYFCLFITSLRDKISEKCTNERSAACYGFQMVEDQASILPFCLVFVEEYYIKVSRMILNPLFVQFIQQSNVLQLEYLNYHVFLLVVFNYSIDYYGFTKYNKRKSFRYRTSCS